MTYTLKKNKKYFHKLVNSITIIVKEYIIYESEINLTLIRNTNISHFVIIRLGIDRFESNDQVENPTMSEIFGRIMRSMIWSYRKKKKNKNWEIIIVEGHDLPVSKYKRSIVKEVCIVNSFHNRDITSWIRVIDWIFEIFRNRTTFASLDFSELRRLLDFSNNRMNLFHSSKLSENDW